MSNYPFHDWDSIRRGKALLGVLAACLAVHFFGKFVLSVLAGQKQDWAIVAFSGLFPAFYLWSLVAGRRWAFIFTQLSYFAILILLAMRHYTIVWADLRFTLTDLRTDLVVDAVQLLFFGYVLFLCPSVRNYIRHQKTVADEYKVERDRAAGKLR